MTNLPALLLSGGLFLTTALSPLVAASSAPETMLLTPKHEAGRCAVRHNCGSKSFFGPQLPCVDNGPAHEPDDALRQQLVELCGPKWAEGPVCCDADQVDTLRGNLKTANQIIASCPACKENFYNMFCTFTCSPDQSLFINVTKAIEKGGKLLVTELDQLISKDYGEGFYDSCKDVKFGPTNSRAMDLIGGGARNYTQLLRFLGQERFGGSPFQINFPDPETYPERSMSPLPMKPKKCNDEDPAFRCACIDCPAVCPELPAVEKAGSCHVGRLPCLSFASILTYSLVLLLTFAAMAIRAAWKRHTKRRGERLRLLADATASEDEDDDRDVLGNRIRPPPAKTYVLNTWCDTAFSRLGHTAARFPALTISTCVLIVMILSAGWFHFEIEKDPARLWVSPTSAAAQEKAFFDENFGPFYRSEKIFLVNDTLPSGPGPVLSYETIVWWMSVEQSIRALKGPKFGSTLQDLCFKPTGDACVVQSVAAYFQDDPDFVDPWTWKDTLRECAESPVNCRPAYGQPLEPNMILGGYPEGGDPVEATAMTVTWVLRNYAEGSYETTRAMDWEAALRDRLLDVQEEARDRGLRLSFSTEISLEEELNKSTNTDAKIVVISYIIMFLYASIALGSTTLSLRDLLRNPAIALVESKFTLGVVGILIVLMSITASIGLFSWVGLRATLIIVDVIPFIVLAVGVDNIFLIVHEFERVNISHPDDVVEIRIAKALGRMGPSILFSAITETICFSLGSFVGMPAVRNFAIYAAGAVLINALLQVTMFISVLTLNQIRVEDARADCFPCVQVKSARVHLDNNSNGFGAAARYYEEPSESLLQQFIRKTYAPALLSKKAKTVIVTVFLGLFAAGVALLPEVELGLDQRVAIPDDSYLIPYFNDLYDYFDAGPPVFFVTREFNATTREGQQKICSRFTTCETMSLTNILEQERKRPDVSYISSPTAGWLDDFFMWLNPDNEACCVERRKPCFARRDPAWNITLSGMPEGEEFVYYLRRFLTAPTSEDCPLAGQASYGDAVVVDTERDTLLASHFRTSHVPLRSQADFINAYAAARRIAGDISRATGLDVFPYSLFYIFFDQYASIVGLTTALLGSAVGIVFIVSSLLLGSVRTATVVTMTVIMTIVDIIGAMAVMGVSLNAVSLVNLIICVGIAVEFCAHVARAFMFPSRTLLSRAKARFNHGSGSGRDKTLRDARAWTALANVGASVFSGITVTKILGVAVLAFTRSKIFEIYYFRIWVALVVFAASHALVFLPVALSLLGGEGYDDVAGDGAGGLEEDLARRRGYGVPGVGAESDSDDSGESDEEDGVYGH
ncbi:hedgehog receptor-like protein [Thermochaetoides thermophila DSM 1495]|uniref:Hedgehog receptor-like protein n=1 Tax=Chaetomium thermophilum (strain DSM 1495 / CBS 144.50 / IMI 039719) TaxID=759272 RepID=G0SAS3_CHATD|nr:hedgehog receptor-like protein [Thermochaetoides thermophila DSM 1495]EGS19845.1 hedgehog receptor-like protein [Thermochaetoides thermophila DSM 1495]